MKITVENDHGDQIDGYCRNRIEIKTFKKKQVKCKENLKKKVNCIKKDKSGTQIHTLHLWLVSLLNADSLSVKFMYVNCDPYFLRETTIYT